MRALALALALAGCSATTGGFVDPREMTVADWCLSMQVALAAGAPVSDYIVQTYAATCADPVAR